jgi:hypothetical protein
MRSNRMSHVAARTTRPSPTVNWGPQQNSQGQASKPLMPTMSKSVQDAQQASVFETGLPALSPDLIVGASARWGRDKGPKGLQTSDPRGEPMEVLQQRLSMTSADLWQMFGGGGVPARILAQLDNDKQIFKALQKFSSQGADSVRVSSHAPRRFQLG